MGAGIRCCIRTSRVDMHAHAERQHSSVAAVVNVRLMRVAESVSTCCCATCYYVDTVQQFIAYGYVEPTHSASMYGRRSPEEC